MSDSRPGPAEYVEYGHTDSEPPSSAIYVFPKVLDLAGDPPDMMRVLDIGCGNGVLAGMFLERGCEVVGLDLSEQGVKIARKRYPEGRFEVMPADDRMLERLGEPPFDLVVSTELIEHLYAPHPFLRGCYGALRPRGRAILSTPYHGYLKNLLIAATGKFDRHVHPHVQGGHIKFWSKRTLTEAMREAGFVAFQFRGAGRAPYLWKSMVLVGTRPA